MERALESSKSSMWVFNFRIQWLLLFQTFSSSSSALSSLSKKVLFWPLEQAVSPLRFLGLGLLLEWGGSSWSSRERELSGGMQESMQSLMFSKEIILAVSNSESWPIISKQSTNVPFQGKSMIQTLPSANGHFFPYFQLVLLLLLVKYVFIQVLNFRQLRTHTLRDLLPQLNQLHGLRETFMRSQRRAYRKLSFEMLALSIRFGVQLMVMLGGVMVLVWQFGGKIVDQKNQFGRGMIYVLFQALRLKAFDLPLSVYQSALLAQIQGVEVPSFAKILYDQFVECSLMLITLPPLLYGYLYIVDSGGNLFYWSVGGFIVLISIFQSILYPKFIQPLVYPIKRMQAGAKRERVNELAKKLGFNLEDIFVQREENVKCHAYLTGIFRNWRLILQSKLEQQLQPEQLEAVVGHQLGHWAEHHSLIKLAMVLVKSLCMFFLFGLFRHDSDIYLSFGFRQKSVIVQTDFSGNCSFFPPLPPHSGGLRVG